MTSNGSLGICRRLDFWLYEHLNGLRLYNRLAPFCDHLWAGKLISIVLLAAFAGAEGCNLLRGLGCRGARAEHHGDDGKAKDCVLDLHGASSFQDDCAVYLSNINIAQEMSPVVIAF
jgi:hypothetical protein